MWPFKRKVIDWRKPNDFSAGDKVECVAANWFEHHECDPQIGDVFTVLDVTDKVNHHGVRCIWLYFKPTAPIVYNSQAFRKLVEADDAAMVERLRKLPVREPSNA